MQFSFQIRFIYESNKNDCKKFKLFYNNIVYVNFDVNWFSRCADGGSGGSLNIQ